MDRNLLVQSVIKGLQNLIELLEKFKKEAMETPAYGLYQTAYYHLGQPRTSNPNNVDKSVACVDHFEEVYFIFKGEYLGGRRLAHTTEANQALLISPHFEKINEPEKGCVVVYVTEGDKHGHILIAGKDRENPILRRLMSNNSLNGLWEDDYTVQSADAYYIGKLGLQRFCYRPI